MWLNELHNFKDLFPKLIYLTTLVNAINTTHRVSTDGFHVQISRIAAAIS